MGKLLVPDCQNSILSKMAKMSVLSKTAKIRSCPRWPKFHLVQNGQKSILSKDGTNSVLSKIAEITACPKWPKFHLVQDGQNFVPSKMANMFVLYKTAKMSVWSKTAGPIFPLKGVNRQPYFPFKGALTGISIRWEYCMLNKVGCMNRWPSWRSLRSL